MGYKNYGIPAAKDFDVIAGILPSNARSDGGNELIVVLNLKLGTEHRKSYMPAII